MRFKGTEAMTFKELALSGYSKEDCEISETDWYNAYVRMLCKNEWNDSGIVRNKNASELSRQLMRWYEYMITLTPGQSIVNKVEVPMYPVIDAGYEPTVYGYTYLLSPAKTWKAFGDLEIVINTPYYLIDGKNSSFEKTASGYKMTLDGLPDGELRFKLSTEEKVIRPKGAYFPIEIVIVLSVCIAAALAITVTVIICIKTVGKRRHKHQ